MERDWTEEKYKKRLGAATRHHESDEKDQYPLRVLPSPLQNAIEEVLRHTQAPVSLIASSALSALSVACQNLIDVSRDIGGKKHFFPCSLFFLTIAESGERKTTCDKFFTRAIEGFDASRLAEYNGDFKNYDAEHRIWTLKLNGLERKLLSHIKRGEDSTDVEQHLKDHIKVEPKKPMKARILFSDASPAAIMNNLQNNYRSIGIFSDEAGRVFSGKTLEDLPVLNSLWGGDPVKVDRLRDNNSYRVDDGRVSISLMSQKNTLREFIIKGGALARDNGFWARCLISCPTSTQGNRLIQDEDITKNLSEKGALDNFNKIIESLLNQSWRRYRNGVKKMIIGMDEAATQKWVMYYNAIEKATGPNGEFAEIKDAASKAGENIIRLAGLLLVIESHKPSEGQKIEVKHIDAAHAVVQWHLGTFKKVFSDRNFFSNDAEHAELLYSWLKEKCKENGVPLLEKRWVRQHGPSKLRSMVALNKALDILVEGRLIALEDRLSAKGIMTEYISLGTGNTLPNGGWTYGGMAVPY